VVADIDPELAAKDLINNRKRYLGLSRGSCAASKPMKLASAVSLALPHKFFIRLSTLGMSSPSS
jgi:hypothetical protein